MPPHRLISVSGEMDIQDAEWLFNDERATRTEVFQLIILSQSPGGRTTAFQSWIERMGGDIRVELRMTFKLDQPNNESVTLLYDAELFEGFGEDNNDLDGHVKDTVTIRKDRDAVITITVRNTAERTRDRAVIRLIVVNTSFTSGEE